MTGQGADGGGSTAPAQESAPGAVPALRLAAAGITLIAACYGLARFAYGLFVPVLSAEFGLSAAAAGAIASASYAGYCAAVVAASAATPRWGPRAVAVAAGAAAASGTGLIAAAPGAAVLAAGVVLTGASSGAVSPPLAGAVARWVRPRHADRVQSVVNAGTGLGVMVSGPVALLFAEEWRLPWAVFACAATAATLWTAAVVPPHRGRLASAARSGGGRGIGAGSSAPGHRGRPARTPAARGLPAGAPRLLAAAGVMGAASSAVWTFGRDVAVAQGASEPASTGMWIVLGAAGLFGALTGDIAARAGLRRAWFGGMVALAAATAGLVLAAGSTPGIQIAGGLFGAVYIALTAVLLLWGTRVYTESPAYGVGAAFLAIAAGQAAASPAVGALSDAFGPGAAFASAALVAAAGAALGPAAGRRPHRPERARERARAGGRVRDPDEAPGGGGIPAAGDHGRHPSPPR
ncbi:MFS transporter [Streptomonospora wellingtoniae]|uniref:MFS transporter n=1 Tax=Streptomonospora wellingtoniae TaxID=3075544 RepID=A0ABU2KRD3_9ACTN|nr:MFS transporter [Streptomonospora sp. DSM 45055]MDT0301840.1 MFS transporter [Streptomonospora sp. DSM 45055]